MRVAGSPLLASYSVMRTKKIFRYALGSLALSHVARLALRYGFSADTAPQRRLSMELCGGHSNQIFSVVFGLLLAQRMKLSPILPNVTSDGLVSQRSRSLAFGELFDTPHFVKHIETSTPIRFAARRLSATPSSHVYCRSSDTWGVCKQLIVKNPAADVLIGCSFGKPLWTPEVFEGYEHVTLDILSAFRPSKTLLFHADAIQRALSTHANASFIFLHLRVEDDWIEHCNSLENVLYSTGCWTSTRGALSKVKDMRLATDWPIYVAFDTINTHMWHKEEIQVAKTEVGLLNRMSVRETVYNTPAHIGREALAVIDHELAERSSIFFGNSVSSFSALILLTRASRVKPAVQYNRGGIPSSIDLPVHRLPWVFVASDFDSVTAAIQQVQFARKGGFIPYCIVTNDTQAYATVLKKAGVQILVDSRSTPRLHLIAHLWEFEKLRMHNYVVFTNGAFKTTSWIKLPRFCYNRRSILFHGERMNRNMKVDALIFIYLPFMRRRGPSLLLWLQKAVLDPSTNNLLRVYFESEIVKRQQDMISEDLRGFSVIVD